MLIGSLGAFVGRAVLSFFLYTPSITELKADASYLFDVVYPLEWLFTWAGFFAAGFWVCFYAAYKIHYSRGVGFDSLKMKVQFIVPSLLISVFNIWEGFSGKFNDAFGMQFWYPAAVFSSLFKAIDKTDLLEIMTSNDAVTNSFVLDCLCYRFNGLTIVFAVIAMAGFTVACYYGRKHGMKKGIAKKQEYLSEIRGKT